MKNKKKPTMTREEAVELYGRMQQTMKKVLDTPKNHDISSSALSLNGAATTPLQSVIRRQRAGLDRGQLAAAFLVVGCAVLKVVVGGCEFIGLGAQAPAHAAVMKNIGPKYSESELQLLKSLDLRRSELEDRRRRLDDRERDLNRRDQEFAGRFAQLRELTGILQEDREDGQKRQKAQVDQLANVYGSMNPSEAAALLGQLDVATTLALLERMPEKRMGQILSLMSADRAVTITKMLSSRGGIESPEISAPQESTEQ